MNLRAFLPLPGETKTAPSLMFSAEEIANIRCMLRRSDWCCAVTNKMREYLARPEVIEYLENSKQ